MKVGGIKSTELRKKCMTSGTLRGKGWSTVSLVPSPRQEDLFLPHVYRSPLEVTAA